MKTIKIIDLLNKIANGEEVPKKIKYDDKIWILKETPEDYDYYSDNEEDLWPFLDEYITLHFDLTDILSWEVEILDKEYIGKQSIEATIKYIQVGMKGIIKEKELIKKYSKDEFEDIKEVEYHYERDGTIVEIDGSDWGVDAPEKMLIDKVNSLIYNQKKIIERLNKLNI